jgi:cell wall-associated NlpC family hydrolase
VDRPRVRVRSRNREAASSPEPRLCAGLFLPLHLQSCALDSSGMRCKVALLSACVAAMLEGCAVTPPIAPERAPEDTSSAARTTAASEVAFAALALVGTPYAARGSSPETGFDCSGLVAYVYARALQLSLPRSTFELARSGMSVKPTALQPGDLVFYNTLARPFSHVGIYLGELRFVHAPSAGGTVRVEDMRAGYWSRRFNGARRVAF